MINILKKEMEEEPEYGGRKYLEKQDFILAKQREQLSVQQEKLEELTLKIDDAEQLLDDVSEAAYDNAVEIVTDKVREQTQAEDITKDVKRAVEVLELDEVQHGIAAVHDMSVMRYLADHHIRLNITPTSNIMLGRVKDISQHPIAELYRNGVDVTINSDDILIFDSDVSKEYLRLYETKCLTANELDDIRLCGLQ